ncbi:hypothetical protein L873DRAFT_1493033 [Choiromyces venosus 120613-1]|uniref:INSIG-domain-containing protein n=1 Tax=Choiromyces venosus 120613-1 TaxID=1336337 RepID=A0A3N4J6T0_9PEZI|nr:hypothetical protein L873DRAFT_1493033 [Choiromyces venosus 120613-1]
MSRRRTPSRTVHIFILISICPCHSFSWKVSNLYLQKREFYTRTRTPASDICFVASSSAAFSTFTFILHAHTHHPCRLPPSTNHVRQTLLTSGAPKTSKYKASSQRVIILSTSKQIMSTSSDLPLLRPIPRRPQTIDTDSPSPSPNATPSPLLSTSDNLTSPVDSLSPTEFGPPKRTKSAIALTSSTLFGIYSLSDDANKDTESSTPLLSRNSSVLNMADFDIKRATPSPVPIKRARREPVPWYMVAMRGVALFALGVAYGAVVTHLHNSKKFSQVTVDIDRYNPRYLVQWGLAGVVLGSLLPWLDGEDADTNGSTGAKIDWDPAVRSIGAFVGIAYAIRKLPWQSTLQVSVSLSLVNPFLWYLIDRTRVGFWLSAAVGVAGTAFLLQTNPEMIQTPETLSFPDESKIAGLVSVESFGVTVWIASVLFCSCVCFGNIGRRLASLERKG